MGLSRRGKVFPGPLDMSLVLKLLPQVVLSLVATLPHEDQEILVHLVAWNFALPSSKAKEQSTSNPRSGSVAREKGSSESSRQRKVGDNVFSQSTASRQCNQGVVSVSRPDRHTRLLLENEANGRRSSASPAHRPILGCNCFECYSSFWSRWNTSSNSLAIADILDTLDEHILEDPSWQDALSRTLGDMDFRRQHATRDGDGEGRLQDESHRVTPAAKPGKGRRTSTNPKRRKREPPKTQNEILAFSGANGENDNVVGDSSTQSTVEVGTTSLLLGGHLDDGRQVAENVLVTDKTDNRLYDSPSSQSTRPEGNSSMEALDALKFAEQGGAFSANDFRMEQPPKNKYIRGQGFLGRFFPDALGRLAERLWDIICPGREGT
eukprot:c27317_g1_i1 orf=642-1778(+)